MYDDELTQQLYNESVLNERLAIVTATGAKLSIEDGQLWCWSTKAGLIGSGDTPNEALVNFNEAFYNERLKVTNDS